jgi:methyl-accepting chemotaxis protein
MKGLLGLAFALLKRVSFRASFVLCALLFLLAAGLAVALAAAPGALPLPAPSAYGLVGLLLVAALYLLTGVYAYMTLGIARVVQLTERIASGELVNSHGSRDHSTRGADDARLWDSILNMNRNLTDIVYQVRSSADSIVMAARDIRAGHTDLSARTQDEAASLEETASGIEELAASAQQNANHCAEATRLAGGATEVTTRAAAQIEQLARTMKAIDDSARQAGEILGAVQSIAFQTNILALNAAVVAAHAGAHGRAFAVVASEVRSLAQRTADAAREIDRLTAESQGSAAQGRALADTVAGTMNEVVGSVKRVGQVIADIALASSEQSSGVEQINKAIAQIDEATQQNAALVEQAAAATASFELEAARLVNVVGRFKVDRGEDRSRVVAFVKSATKHLRRVGLQQACADFSDRQGRFVDGEYYLFALDMNCRRLAYAPDPSTIGRDDSELRDADGRRFSYETVQRAKNAGFGWYDYRMLNPRTGRVQPKSVYFERVGEVVIGCGIYHSEQQAQPAAAPARAQPAGYLESSWPQLGSA